MSKVVREQWIDWAKLIGMFLVILGHLEWGFDGLLRWTYAFHLPLFFVVSGYLHRDHGTFRVSLFRNARTLLLPYVLFYGVTYFWWLALWFPGHPEVYPDRTVVGWLVKPILGMLAGTSKEHPAWIMTNGPLWFLVGLFMTKLLFALVQIAARRSATWFIALHIPIVLAIPFLVRADIPNIFAAGSALLALPFYSLGFLARQWSLPARMSTLPQASVGLVATGVLLFFLAPLNGRVSIGNINDGGNTLLFLFNGILGTVMIAAAGRLLERLTIPQMTTLAAGTLTTMALHSIIVSVIRVGLARILGVSPATTVGYALILSLATLLLSLPPILIINRWAPIFTGRATRHPARQS
jgi:acyltransferase